MPHKNPETKRAYFREYMQRRRAVVKPGPEVGLIHTQEGPGASRRLDRTRPYTVESRYPWPAYLVQDDLWFDPNTGEVVGAVK
jgi:hypothetical protein